MGKSLSVPSESQPQLLAPGKQGTSFNVARVLVPSKPLRSEAESSRLKNLAKKRGCLVDEGGASSYNKMEDAALVRNGHEHGFISAVTNAFKDHYPLILRPQHIWLLVLQAVSVHVEQNSEALRSKWVQHSGRTTLDVNCDSFVKGRPNDWAAVVDGKNDSFSAQIDAVTAPGVVESLTPMFSESLAAETIAMKITVMDICKSYVDYKCTTCCGFPSVTLEGTYEDWALLREKAETLVANQCTAEFAHWWLEALLPVLDIFVTQYQTSVERTLKEIDTDFWNSMCKMGGSVGSGARTWFNGWFNIFFPYIRGEKNEYCVPYSKSLGYVQEGLVWNPQYDYFSEDGTAPVGNVEGPDCEDFPDGLCHTPVTWSYFGDSVPLQFTAGFVGARQDPLSLAIAPHVGWFITRLPKTSV